jgi:hypothetical protein
MQTPDGYAPLSIDDLISDKDTGETLLSRVNALIHRGALLVLDESREGAATITLTLTVEQLAESSVRLIPKLTMKEPTRRLLAHVGYLAADNTLIRSAATQPGLPGVTPIGRARGGQES